MNSLPQPEDIKALLSDLVPHGQRKRMAALLGVSEGDIARRLNPNDERKLGIYEGMRELRTLSLCCPKEFEAVWTFIRTTVESWKSIPLKADPGEVAKEATDYICAELQNKPLHVKRKELVEAVAAGNRRLAVLGLGESGTRRKLAS